VGQREVDEEKPVYEISPSTPAVRRSTDRRHPRFSRNTAMTGVSVRRISAAGVSIGLINHHFPSKSDYRGDLRDSGCSSG